MIQITSKPLPLQKIRIQDQYWTKFTDLVRNVVIPYQWEALNDRVEDADPSHAIQNFRIAAGLEQGDFYGMVFQDSDLAKWLEAVGYSLATNPDPELERVADEVIDLIGKAQQEDGYLNTYFTIKEPDKRWTNLTECHELYCAGHMIEAGVSYYEATGKRKLLDIVSRLADIIDSVFGPEPDKMKGYPGHQEIELALVKLHHVTGDERYLNLSRYFINERGSEPNYFLAEWENGGKTSHWHAGAAKPPHLPYFQCHLPVREQSEASGHAVRAVYMYSGMADIAARTGDEDLLAACRRLWNNIVSKQLYITGGIGSTVHGEAFTFDYDLPNDTVYAETCASIGLIFFAHRMLQIEAKGEYADVMERALYNNVVGSMSQDGKHYFYVNPLEVWPDASSHNPGKHHVKPVRQKWFSCACCPPNVARLLASLGLYIYTANESTLYTHLYIGGETEVNLAGTPVQVKQTTDYPWDGHVTVELLLPEEKEFTMALRIPGWSSGASIRVDGEDIDLEGTVIDGYVMLHRRWKPGSKVELEVPMEVQVIRTNPHVRANNGKVALQRGPLVYCLEEADNGSLLASISVSSKTEWTPEYDENLLGGAVVLRGQGSKLDTGSWEDNSLYRTAAAQTKPVSLTAIPYFLWGNREPGEMTVWIREQ